LNQQKTENDIETTQAALIELCAAGLLTCTCGKPGERGATYAVAWLPLDDPEQYSRAVRERHAENMRATGQATDTGAIR
jgi:hypothetical protein